MLKTFRFHEIMKVLVLPDTHGNLRNFECIKKHIDSVDKIIFLGDYFDSHYPEYNFEQQKNAFLKIMNFKKSCEKPVVVFLGNHDLGYLPSYKGDTNISPHQYEYQKDIEELLTADIENLQILDVVDNWIFSHAGISNKWLARAIKYLKHLEPNTNPNILDLNRFLHQHHDLSFFNHCSNDPYGDDEAESCMWIRPPSLIGFGLIGYNQVVGHTAMSSDALYYNIVGSNVTTLREFLNRFTKPVARYHTDRNIEHDSLDEKYVFLDTPDQSSYAIIDTQTNDVMLFTSD